MDQGPGLPEGQEPGGVAPTGDKGAVMRPGKGMWARTVLRVTDVSARVSWTSNRMTSIKACR